jgi:ATP-binding cassette subfamily B protein
VQFSTVTFAYPRTEPVLSNVSFRLEAGRVLGLVGRTGSGKTTLIRLLARFYDPQDGVVLLGGMDIRLARLAALRSRIGLVTQDVQLFSASLRDNLAFFVTSISDDTLISAIRDLGLGDWFESLPDGLDTAIAPDRLSAGEAQLLALTRVFLTNPGLVILDEASSRLDPITEARLERALDRLLAGRTAIIIAHRLATLDRVDEIMILEHGEVVEAGPAAALRDDPRSRYAELHRLAAMGVLP